MWVVLCNTTLSVTKQTKFKITRLHGSSFALQRNGTWEFSEIWNNDRVLMCAWSSAISFCSWQWLVVGLLLGIIPLYTCHFWCAAVSFLLFLRFTGAGLPVLSLSFRFVICACASKSIFSSSRSRFFRYNGFFLFFMWGLLNFRFSRSRLWCFQHMDIHHILH